MDNFRMRFFDVDNIYQKSKRTVKKVKKMYQTNFTRDILFGEYYRQADCIEFGRHHGFELTDKIERHPEYNKIDSYSNFIIEGSISIIKEYVDINGFYSCIWLRDAIESLPMLINSKKDKNIYFLFSN